MRRQRRSRAQALTEMAMILPVLALLMLGAADLGRAFYINVEIAGASRAGMRNGVLDAATDIGAAARSEPNSAIPNTTAVWGDTGPGGLNADCTSAAQKCGDPTGCPPAVFTGGRLVCFAIRSCILVSGVYNCTGPWGVRPTQGSDQALDVRVVYKFTPVTPLISNLATATGGFFYLTTDTLGLELY